jgi:hypothetical protein
MIGKGAYSIDGVFKCINIKNKEEVVLKSLGEVCGDEGVKKNIQLTNSFQSRQ